MSRSVASCGRLIVLEIAPEMKGWAAAIISTILAAFFVTSLLVAQPAVNLDLPGRPVAVNPPQLVARADALLHACPHVPQRLVPATLAATLHQGALRELELTPKPGLVDRHDNGSHPDLSFDLMQSSANLLPLYYDDLLRLSGLLAPMEELVQAGRDAEARMFRAIGSNGHKGYIFLSGLVLLAACQCQGRLPALRGTAAALAARFFAVHGAQGGHGALLREQQGLGGIRDEVEKGLPAVFEHGWPRYRSALDDGWEPARAAFLLMAVLMQQVEDTTTVPRGGLEGLARLRQDGARLQELLERDGDPGPLLATLNEEYRMLRLTMGGVADCMALTFALQGAAD